MLIEIVSDLEQAIAEVFVAKRAGEFAQFDGLRLLHDGGSATGLR